MKKITQLVLFLTLTLGINHVTYAHFSINNKVNSAQVNTDKVIYLTAKERGTHSAYITSGGHKYRYQLQPVAFNKYSALQYSRQYLTMISNNSYVTSARSYWP